MNTKNKTKFLFKSKTVVFNLIVAVAGVVAFFLPDAKAFVTENAAAILALIGVINMILRSVTKQGIALFPLLILGLILSLSSCVSTGNPNEYRGALTGILYKQDSVSGQWIPHADEKTLAKVAQSVAILEEGGSVREVLLKNTTEYSGK